MTTTPLGDRLAQAVAAGASSEQLERIVLAHSADQRDAGRERVVRFDDLAAPLQVAPLAPLPRTDPRVVRAIVVLAVAILALLVL